MDKMESQSEFEKSLQLSKITLLLSGIKVSSKGSVLLNKGLSFLFYFNFFWLYTDVAAEFYWLIEGIILGKNFSELTLTAPCTTICLLATAKSTPLYYNRDLLVIVFEQIRNIHPKELGKPDDGSDLRNNENEANKDDLNINDYGEKAEMNYEITEEKSKKIEGKIVKDAIKFLNMVIFLLFTCSIAVVIAFSLMPLVSMAYDYKKEGVLKFQLPFLSKYFFDPFTQTTWPIMYFHQVYSTCIAGLNVFSADTSLYVFCTYIQMHFRILCHRLENVVSGNQRQTRAKLLELARRHQKLIHLVNEVEVVYSKSTLFNVITSSLLICLSAFNVTFLDDMGAVFAFVTFLVMNVSQISLLCLFGDMLMTSSIKVSDAVYNCRWYATDQDTKKSMLLMLMRYRTDINTATYTLLREIQPNCDYIECPSVYVDVFLTILSRSWSYFALLKTMYK